MKHDPFRKPIYRFPEQCVMTPLEARGIVDENGVKVFQDYPLGKQWVDFEPQSCKVEHVFNDHESRLVELIAGYKAAVGCVAWVNNDRLLEALSQLDAVTIVVQKELDLAPTDLGPSELYDGYLRLRPFITTQISDRFGAALPVSVRCFGVTGKDARAKMHHKFLVLGDRDAEGSFIPQIVWSGSSNFTENATQSLDDATIFYDSFSAMQFTWRFCRILLLSEPLDFNGAFSGRRLIGVTPELWLKEDELDRRFRELMGRQR